MVLKCSENSKLIRKLTSFAPKCITKGLDLICKTCLAFVWIRGWNDSEPGVKTAVLGKYKWKMLLRTRLVERKGNFLCTIFFFLGLIFPIKNLVRAWLA